jgi:ATP-dependent exoDNAse (exonuclease V) alpha subunit
MAIYHLSVKPVSRGVGRSSTAASAYRAAARVADERTGETFDYTRKRGVEHAEIVLPSAAASEAEWARDRQRLWNAAERAENRKDARVAREYEVALPYELNATQRLGLVRAFAQELADRHGCAVDVAVHAPHREGDTRNHHAHLLTTTRAVATAGLGTKTDIELKDADRARKGLGPARGEVTAIRERWATLVNEHLAQHGHAARIDHRSLDAQGLDRAPTQHKGPAVTAIERRGERTRVGDRIREDVAERLKLAAELGRLERESRVLARSIIDTTADLKAALADRAEVAAHRSAEDLRRDARESWLQVRPSIVGNAATETRQPALDLGGDLAAARREAREQWLAQRMSAEQSSAKETEAVAPEKSPPRIILPGSEHEIK